MTFKRASHCQSQSGFTLIELSIVLVIIGLIVGGVLVGQDLIKAAEIRATVGQIEKYNTSVNAFRSKYKGIPGDIPNAANFWASLAGGTASQAGEGNGDGLVQSLSADDTVCATLNCVSGEGAIFWYQLAQANLISEAITTTDFTDVTLAISDSVLPLAKMGKGIRVAVNAAGGLNYFVLANTSGTAASGVPTYAWGLTPTEAFQIDSKIDDGLPAIGTVVSISAAAAPGTAVGNPCATGTASTSIYSTVTTPNTASCNLAVRGAF
ncbi:MAG: prepilin-type N-terminal cleavage/methylation domain-containing protein [Rickettsiales bacterium]|nr:prepilin-type N-terminal cleavage/methylation domain-containing protein [Rickettsiales bacterium]